MGQALTDLGCYSAQSPLAPRHGQSRAKSRSSGAKVSFVSLGCPKALVDSERIVTRLRAEGGYELSREHKGSDLVIVNTCGFLDSAKAESLAAIGNALKENGKVIVTGCMGAEPDSISSAYPDVLAITGRNSTKRSSRQYTRHYRRSTIRISIWCRRRASSSRRGTTPI